MAVSLATLVFVLLAASQKPWPSLVGLTILGVVIMLT